MSDFSQLLGQRYTSKQTTPMPMTTAQFLETSSKLQGCIIELTESLLTSSKPDWEELRRADWAFFAIEHWERRLVMATQWLEMPSFRIFDHDGGTFTGPTAHNAATPLAVFFDPGFNEVPYGDETLPHDIVGWKTEGLSTLIAKLRQECILLEECAVPSDEAFTMKSLSIALDLSDNTVRKYADTAGLERGQRGTPRGFNQSEVRAICETILDEINAGETTRQSAMKLLSRLTTT